MTLILGINLSNRLYMVADTLVTKKINGISEPIEYIFKLIQFSSSKFDSYLSVAFAGNRSLAFYIYQKIDNAIDEGVLSTDIEELA
jgi:hypothetical protein